MSRKQSCTYYLLAASLRLHTQTSTYPQGPVGTQVWVEALVRDDMSLRPHLYQVTLRRLSLEQQAAAAAFTLTHTPSPTPTPSAAATSLHHEKDAHTQDPDGGGCHGAAQSGHLLRPPCGATRRPTRPDSKEQPNKEKTNWATLSLVSCSLAPSLRPSRGHDSNY